MLHDTGIDGEEELAYGLRYEVCTKVSYQYYYDDDIDTPQHVNQSFTFNMGQCDRYASLSHFLYAEIYSFS